MPHSSQKQRVSIIVDAHLLAENKLTDNRSAAFEEAPAFVACPENWGAVETVLPESQSSRYSEEEEGSLLKSKWKKLSEGL